MAASVPAALRRRSAKNVPAAASSSTPPPIAAYVPAPGPESEAAATGSAEASAEGFAVAAQVSAAAGSVAWLAMDGRAVAAFVEDLRTGSFRAGLRVKRVQQAPGVYELTWSMGTGPAGRATWE